MNDLLLVAEEYRETLLPIEKNENNRTGYFRSCISAEVKFDQSDRRATLFLRSKCDFPLLVSVDIEFTDKEGRYRTQTTKDHFHVVPAKKQIAFSYHYPGIGMTSVNVSYNWLACPLAIGFTSPKFANRDRGHDVPGKECESVYLDTYALYHREEKRLLEFLSGLKYRPFSTPYVRLPEEPMVLEETPLPAGMCAIVVASRQTMQEVQAYIADFKNTDEWSWAAYETSNGWIAISAGVVPNAQYPDYLTSLKETDRIPQDAFCMTSDAIVQKLALN